MAGLVQASVRVVLVDEITGAINYSVVVGIHSVIVALIKKGGDIRR